MRFAAALLLAASGLAVPAAQAAVTPKEVLCNIAFLHQTSEPDSLLIRSTLFRALAKEHRLILSARFHQHLWGVFKAVLSYRGANGRAFQYSADQNYELFDGSWHAEMPSLFEGIRGLRAAQEFYHRDIDGGAARVWELVVADWLVQEPLQTFKLYPEIPLDHYQSVRTILEAIEADSRLKSLVLQTIREIALSMDEWGKDFLGGFVSPDYRKKKMDLLADRLLKNKETLPFPESAIKVVETGKPVDQVLSEPAIDYQPMRIVFERELSDVFESEVGINTLDRELSQGLSHLTTGTEVEQERFLNDGRWKRLYEAAGAWLRNQKDSAAKIALIRALSAAEMRLQDQLRLITDQAGLARLAGYGIESRTRIASQSPDPSAPAVKQRLQSLKTRLDQLSGTLTVRMESARQALQELAALSGQLQDGTFDADGLRRSLQAFQSQLSLDSKLLNRIRKGWL